MSLSLPAALRVQSPCAIAFIGSGGKTTALFQLARQLKPPVIVTATSHMGDWQVSLADHHIIATDESSLDGLKSISHDVLVVTGDIENGRTNPVSDMIQHRLRKICLNQSIPLLIEADGARQKPLKAWADHEPPIPAFTDIVILVAGMDGLGKPPTEDVVHRAALFSATNLIPTGGIVTREVLIDNLLHHGKPWDRIPNGARRVVLLNQADTPEKQAAAGGMVPELLSRFHSVIIASLAQEEIFAAHEAIAGIVLAAGESRRYGQTKQVLDWHGEPFVHAVAGRALEAGLDPVLVVTGANGQEIENAMAGLDVQIVRNQSWNLGQSESIKAGLRALDERSAFSGGCIFLLADQPQITPSVLQALVENHAGNLHQIIAPMVMDQRANPVLFDRATFPDLLTLEGDVGGRAIFDKYRVEYLPWHDDRLLLDVDTPEQYQRLIEDETL